MLDDGRVIRVNSDPIGIDVPALETQILDPQVYSMCHFLKDRHVGKKLLVSRDKFDHIKGLKPKLLAYERFLADHPEWVEKVRFHANRGIHRRWFSFK
jgi:trehalose 6-phosphate synthase/phosphatase